MAAALHLNWMSNALPLQASRHTQEKCAEESLLDQTNITGLWPTHIREARRNAGASSLLKGLQLSLAMPVTHATCSYAGDPKLYHDYSSQQKCADDVMIDESNNSYRLLSP